MTRPPINISLGERLGHIVVDVADIAVGTLLLTGLSSQMGIHRGALVVERCTTTESRLRMGFGRLSPHERRRMAFVFWSPRRLALAGAFVTGIAGGLVGTALSRGRHRRRR